MKNEVVSKEVALEDLEKFVNKFVKKPVPVNELEETYPDVLDAIMEGHLSFDENNIPELKLKFPIKGEDDNIALSKISFRTRIKPTQLADIAKGLHPQKEIFTLQLKMTSYIIDQPVAMLDKFDRYDYDVISQVASVFT
tara:strand:+ start:10 stop:426 length:417 start_codon:yes stop_codon:yes gene_type:complete